MEPSSQRPAGRFATRAVHVGATPIDVAEEPLALAIHPVSTWAAARSADLGDLLDDRKSGYVYGRYGNPTSSGLHAAVASLHDADAAWSFASGTAAIHAAIEAVRRGGRVLATRELYGGTYALLRRMQATSGWGVDLVDLSDPDAVGRSVTSQHTVLYAETIANPTTTVFDLAALGEQARAHGLAFVVDHTFATPYLCRPVAAGATLIVESATKYLGGHSDVIAGTVAGAAAAVTAARDVGIEVGGTLGPFEAWLVARGIQTLPLRMERACSNALAIARDLDGRDGIERVRYPGLTGHPQHQLATRQFEGRGYGAIVTVDLADRATAEAFADGCRVFARAASIGGTHSLVIHSASTTHRQLTDADLAAAGIGPGTVRLSVGIEDVDDLREDLDGALAAARSAAASPTTASVR